MRIQQVENAVGVTKKNIRFYEEQGLLRPRRNVENGYRDYEEEDVRALYKIKLLRTLAVPIEEIRTLQSGKLTLADCLRRHEIALEREQRNLERMKEICAELREQAPQYGSLDAKACLDRIRALEQEGARFMDVKATDKGKKLRGALMGSGVLVLLMLGLMALGVWARLADGMPLGVMLIFVLIPLAVIIGVIAALSQRIREIEGGEEDEASKY